MLCQGDLERSFISNVAPYEYILKEQSPQPLRYYETELQFSDDKLFLHVSLRRARLPLA